MLRFIFILTVISLSSLAQIPIQYYDFESNASRSTSELSAEFNINSVTDNSLSSVGGALSGSTGNPSSGSSVFRSSWDGNGVTDPGISASDYIEFVVNTTGFSEIFLSADFYGSSLWAAAAGNVALLYSTDGSTFSTTSSYDFTNSFTNNEWDLSAISSINSNSEVTLRLYAYGDLTGTEILYLDNLTISARKVTATKTLADYSLITAAQNSVIPIFNDLIIDGSGATITLSSDINIQSLLRLTNGIVETNSYSVVADSNCTVESYSSNSYVNGNFTHIYHNSPAVQTKTFPVGSSNDYRPAKITLDVATPGKVTVTHVNSTPSYSALPAGISSLSSQRYWSVDIGSGMTFGVSDVYGIQLYFGGNDGINDASAVEVVRGSNGGIWTESDNSGTGSDWVFGSFNSPSNSDFAFGDGGENPLPVELIEFDSFVENRSLILYWVTATEVNTFQYVIQRKNIDTNKWEPRGEVLAYGTSNSPKHYNFLEEEPILGTSFYRLKIIDLDGSFEFSKQIVVEYDKNITDLESEVEYNFNLAQNYPNPFNPSTEIVFSVPSQSNVNLSIFNSLGELITNLSSGIVEAGEHNLKWNASNSPSGIYYLHLRAKTIDGNKLFNKTKKMILVK